MSEPAPGQGHNNPPPYDVAAFATLREMVNNLAVENKPMMDKGRIGSDEEAKLVADNVSGINAAIKKIEAQKKIDKEPFVKAGDEVVRVHGTLVDALNKIKTALGKMQTQHLIEVKAKKAEADRLAAEAARKARAEADRLAAEAARSNDVMAQVEAEQAQKDAAAREKAAERQAKETVKVGSATGGGRTMALRVTRHAEVISLTKLFMHFREAPEVMETLVSLANRDIRSGAIDETKAAEIGIAIKETEKAA